MANVEKISIALPADMATLVRNAVETGDYASSSIRHFQLSSRTYSVKDSDSQGFFQRYDANYGVVTGGRLARTAP